MTEIKKKVYLAKQIENENKRIEEFKKLFASRDNSKKNNKNIKRIEEICTILEISVPK